MANDFFPEKNSEKTEGRFQKPLWRFLSVIVAILSLSALFYSIFRKMFIIPAFALLFFLLLWFGPIFWTWLEEIFGKRPRSTWGRFSMNLAIATLIAIMVEDTLEVFLKGFRFIEKMLR